MFHILLNLLSFLAPWYLTNITLKNSHSVLGLLRTYNLNGFLRLLLSLKFSVLCSPWQSKERIFFFLKRNRVESTQIGN